MIEECWLSGQFPVSMNTGMLTLIHKADDHDNLKNFRPISLTNCDYKIIAFVFAERLQNIIAEIINTDQSGYIRGRYIGCNVRNIIDIYDFTETFNLGGAMISIDFEKAFDTLEHDFIYKALEKFNFGPQFITWMKIFYAQPVFRVKNNGWISGLHTMTRGIRQGCPMSALLFIISIELLACDIRNDKSIKGILFGKYEHKICQYADDATILVRDIESIPLVMKCIDKFSRFAGPALNLKKTKGIWLGCLKNLGIRLKYNIVWTGNPVKCLGIYIGHNANKCYKANWTDKIVNIERLLMIWSKRNLSLFGKIQVIKTYALSKVIFPATMLPTSEIIVKKISVLFHNFLWGKRDKIKRSITSNSVESGGIGMPDIEQFFYSLKAGWVIRMANLTGKWKAGFEEFASRLGITYEYLLKMNFGNRKSASFLKQNNSFYVDVIIAFNRCKTIIPLVKMNVSDILNEPIWGNNLFTYKDQCLLFKEMLDSKILFVKDLINEKGCLKSEHELFQEIKVKTNIVEQLYILKNAVLKKLRTFDFSISPYVKINHNIKTILHDDKLHKIKKLKSSFFYKILNKKSNNNNMESIFSREFAIERRNCTWVKIYTQKIKNITIIKLKEFNFKLLHNIVPCGKILSKWKPNISENCELCNEIETTKHMLYDCIKCAEIWIEVSNIVKFPITWKHIVVGMPDYDIESMTVYYYNILFTIISYTFFKEKSHCKFSGKSITNLNLKEAVVKNVIFYQHINNHNKHKFFPLFNAFLAKFKLENIN